MDEHERLLGFRAYYVLYLLRAYVHRSVARRAGEEEKEPRILRKEVGMLLIIFITILICIHIPAVGLIIASPFIVLFIISIFAFINQEREINEWRKSLK